MSRTDMLVAGIIIGIALTHLGLSWMHRRRHRQLERIIEREMWKRANRDLEP